MLGDNIDGSITYVITLAIESLKINLLIADRTQNNPVLSNSQSLMALGVLSCCYENRIDMA